MADFAYSFMLEAFVFISGLILGFQARYSPERLNLKNLIGKKSKRLMLPCVIWSIIYFILLDDRNLTTVQFFYSILNGEGHLWFLPMLFWCFVAIFLLERTRIPKLYCLILAILIALLPMVDLPLRIDYTMSYFVYFYCGYYLTSENKVSKDLISNKLTLLFVFIGYIGIFCLFNYTEWSSIFESEGFIGRIAVSFFTRLGRLTYSSLGIAFIYLWALDFIVRNNVSQNLITLSTYCFGVYIFQQFILKSLYYHSSFCDIFGVWFPIIGALFTLSASLLLSGIMMKSKVGRMLIG